MARPTSRKKSELSQAVVDLRSHVGESQQAFANRMGIALNTVARYETTRTPQGKILAQLAEISDGADRPDLAAVFRNHLAEEMGMGASAVKSLSGASAQELIETLLGRLEDLEKRAKKLKVPSDSVVSPIHDEIEGAILSELPLLREILTRWSLPSGAPAKQTKKQPKNTRKK